MPGSSPTAAQLGLVIRRLRKQRDLSIEDLAGEAGIHTTYLSGIERGRRNPSWNVVRALAEALTVDISAIARLAEEADESDGNSPERSPDGRRLSR